MTLFDCRSWFFRWVLAVALAMSVAPACEKGPRAENVYTGRVEDTGPAMMPPRTDASMSSPDDGGAASMDAGVPNECAFTPPADIAFTKQALIEAFAGCAMQRYCLFEARAKTLDAAVTATQAAPTPENLEIARAAFRVAMGSWQEAELFRFGPAARGMEPGGRDLRDEIYSWPLVSRCKVEEQLVGRADAAPDFGASLVNGRGLDALEYLLFYEGTDNACSQFSPINAEGSWVALGEEGRRTRKLEYSAAVARDVVSTAGVLRAAWDPSGDDFRAQMTTAGRGSTVFESEQAALNAVSAALFYVDKELKDWKLARPSGLLECTSTICPDAIESPYAHISTDNIRRNLAGARDLLEGCAGGGAGLGFDDWLRAIGATDLEGRLIAALRNAESAVDQLEPTLADALREDPARVHAVHAAVKQITDLLKSEFVTVLNLEIPMAAEGDND